MEKTGAGNKKLFILVILLTTLMQAGATSLIKLGMNLMTAHPRNLVFIPVFVIAMCLYCGALPLYTKALANMKLAVVQPIVSGSMFLYTVLFAVLFFKESFTFVKALGIAGIIGGIVTVAL